MDHGDGEWMQAEQTRELGKGWSSSRGERVPVG